MRRHRPLGPGGIFKTGQRVPASGEWADQYGLVTTHEVGATFPPCLDRKGECAFRHLVKSAAGTA